MQIKSLPFVNYAHDFFAPSARHGISLRWRREQRRDLGGAKLIMSRRSKTLQCIPFFSAAGLHQITLTVFKTRPVCWYLMSESRPQAEGEGGREGGGGPSSFSSGCPCWFPSPYKKKLTPDRPLWQSRAARSHLTLPTGAALRAAHPPPRCRPPPPAEPEICITIGDG